jgi:hypothetical protein
MDKSKIDAVLEVMKKAGRPMTKNEIAVETGFGLTDHGIIQVAKALKLLAENGTEISSKNREGQRGRPPREFWLS